MASDLPYTLLRRPFEDYLDQPDTAERTRLAVQSIPFALPPKKEDAPCP